MKILLIVLLIESTSGLDLFLDVTTNSFLDQFEKVLNQTEKSQCTYDLQLLRRDAKLKKTWALKMLDATGKPPSGIMLGNIRQPGSYDECIEVKGVEKVRGKYCLSVVSPADGHIEEMAFMKNTQNVLDLLGINFNRANISDIANKTYLTWGICVPRSCSQDELQLVSNNSEIFFDLNLHFDFKDNRCSTGERKPLSAMGYFAIFFFSAMACVLAASTYYDVKVINKGIHADLYSLFSVYTNSKKLFSTRKSADSLGAINGIRFLSIMWVILGHTYMFNLFFPASTNIIYAFEWSQKLNNVFIMAAPLSVDTFLTISGLLLMYGYMSVKVDKGLDVPWGKFYLHRFMRLTPALLATVIFYTGILPHMGNGPYWFTVETLQYKDCVDNWWSTLLYIQNYQNSLHECVSQTWYLAVDTQLYVLSPIILIPIVKKPKLGLFVISLLLVVTCASSYAITIYYNVGAITMDGGTNYFTYLYHPTHTRAMPWLVGTVWGYYMQKYRYDKVNLKPLTVFILWSLHLTIMLAAMFLHVIISWYDYNPIVAGLFNAFVRPLWGLGICWVIFACYKGYGGIIDVCLNNTAFTILYRFTYCLFLLHMPVLLVIALQRRDPEYFSNRTACFYFWAYFSITLLISLVWVLAFETPMLNLEKIIYGIKSEHSKEAPTIKRRDAQIKESAA